MATSFTVVGTAAKSIAKHNITPDFVVQIEMYNSTKHFTKSSLYIKI